MKRYAIIVLLALCLIAPAAAWQEDFQTGSAPGWTTSLDEGTSAIVQNPYSDTYSLYLTQTGDSGFSYSNSYTRANPQQAFNYFAFTSLSLSVTSIVYSKIVLYNSAGGVVGTSPDLTTYLGSTAKRVEIFRDGSTA